MRPIVLLPSTLLLLALAPAAVSAPPEAPAKKLYCWTEGGRKVCGDALPAAAVNNARVEINARSGMPTARMDRAPTAEERAAAQAEAQRQAQLARVEEARRREEMAMVETYDTEADLRRAYEHRLSLAQGTLKASRMAVDGLRQSLLSLLRRAGEAELMNRPVPKPLADTIRAQRAELAHQQQLLTAQQGDAAQVERDFAAALIRYRALKSGTPDGTPGAAAVASADPRDAG